MLLLLAGCGAASQPADTTAAADPSDTPAETPDSAEPTGAQQGPAGAETPAAEVPSVDPSKGARALESRKIEMQFDLTLFKGEAAAGMQSGNWSVYEERTQDVKSVAGSAIDELLVIYGRREAKPLLGVEEKSVTAGKSFVITSGGAVKSGAGKKVSAAEKAAVLAEYGWVGEPSPLAELLRGMKQGASVEADADARRMLVGVLPGLDHEQTAVTLTLKKIESGKRASATLDVALKAEIAAADMKFALELGGPAVVDVATGWVMSLELGGKVKANGTVKHKQGRLDARGKGKAEIRRSAEMR